MLHLSVRHIPILKTLVRHIPISNSLVRHIPISKTLYLHSLGLGRTRTPIWCATHSPSCGWIHACSRYVRVGGVLHSRTWGRRGVVFTYMGWEGCRIYAHGVGGVSLSRTCGRRGVTFTDVWGRRSVTSEEEERNLKSGVHKDFDVCSLNR